VAASQETRDEIERLRNAFALLADKQDKVLCVFERNYKTSHLQLQLVPIPKRVSKTLRSSFLNAASMKNIDFVFLKEGEQVSGTFISPHWAFCEYLYYRRGISSTRDRPTST